RGMAVALAVLAGTHREEGEVAFREARQPGDAGRSLRGRELAILEIVTGFTADTAERGLISVGDPRLFSLIVFGAGERVGWGWRCGAGGGDRRVAAGAVRGRCAPPVGLGAPRGARPPSPFSSTPPRGAAPPYLDRGGARMERVVPSSLEVFLLDRNARVT